MKIQSINTRYLKIPLGAARGGSGATEVEVIIVELALSSGVVGTGFTYALTGGGKSIWTMIEQDFSNQLIGLELHEWDRKWHEFHEKIRRLGKANALPAISAIDIAIWDLRAKVQNVPLYCVLGAYRDKVPVYGSGRATHAMTIEQLIEGALKYKDEGFGAIKLRAGALGVEKDIQRIAKVREAVGSELKIMVDCNERFTYTDALYFGRHLEELDIYWLEEPLVSEDISGHKRLSEKLNIAIAVGEHLHQRYEFAQYAQSGAASVLMPDVPLVGGFTEATRICTLAETFGASISPHFLPELHIHLAASSRSCIAIEHFPLINDILEEELVIEDGFMIPPNRPGHGIKWDYDAIRKFEIYFT